MMKFLKDNFLILTIPLMLLFLIAGSFYRFVILNDYFVMYEGECDPEVSSCYVGCEDDACKEEYYYFLVERRADEVLELCGPSILECDEAYTCQPEVADCSIIYCDLETEAENCYTLISSANNI